MGRILKDLSFDEWVRHLFDHPVTDPAWHWGIDADCADLEPTRVVAYSTKLFEHAGELLAIYTDGQANQGLWLLISETGSPLYALTDFSIPVEERVRCIRAIAALYEQCFVPRCTPHFSHMDEPGAGPLNGVCYMWWDIFPLYGQPKDVLQREIDAACVSVMESTLELPSIACQESALHGLGHWGHSYRERCQSVISEFMHQHHNLRPELLEYASRAKQTNVL